MPMRRPTVHLAHVLAGGAVALLLSACGQGSTATAPVESASSASASGAIASADLCPEGPPARGSLTDNKFGNDGVVGTVTNNTGAAVWIGKPRVTRTPCLLEAGKGVVYSGDVSAEILVSATPEGRSGTYIKLKDPDLGYPYANVTGFKEGMAFGYACGAGHRADGLSEGESRDFEATNDSGYTGKATVVRLPDDENAANEYSGSTTGTDDWARIDVTVFALGYCS